ncbi:hypothetical protein [Luteibacter rhizovicinus]|nr:hypothetical protein [Luteibacter rhizovicinus]
MFILIASLLNFFSAGRADAACVDFATKVGKPLMPVVYVGELGSRQVRVALWADDSTHVSGFYGYNDKEGTLALRGTLDALKNGVELDEYDESDNRTGHFDLRFEVPAGTFPGVKDLSPYDCEYLIGVRAVGPASTPEQVVLGRDLWLDRRYDEERQQNELTAFHLQRAILKGDAKEVAALLAYPFDTQDEHGVISEWATSDEVLKNYRTTVGRRAADIRSAVPHALPTTSYGSTFSDRSICLSKGKVTQICRSGCKDGCP